MKHSNFYLYGVDEVPEIDALVITRRIELLKDNLSIVLDQSYHTRDDKKVSAILKAIKHWESIGST